MWSSQQTQEKHSAKFPTPFHYRNTQQIKNRRELSKHYKGTYEKPTANSERLKTFPLRSGGRQGWASLFNTVLEV